MGIKENKIHVCLHSSPRLNIMLLPALKSRAFHVCFPIPSYHLPPNEGNDISGIKVALLSCCISLPPLPAYTHLWSVSVCKGVEWKNYFICKRERSPLSSLHLIIPKQRITTCISLLVFSTIMFFSFLQLSFIPLFMWTGWADQTVEHSGKRMPDSTN